MNENMNHWDRRAALRLLLAAPVTLAGVSLVTPDAARAAALTREEREAVGRFMTDNVGTL